MVFCFPWPNLGLGFGSAYRLGITGKQANLDSFLAGMWELLIPASHFYLLS